MKIIQVEIGFLLALASVGVIVGYYQAIQSPVFIDEITYARLGYSLAHGHLASDSSFLPLYQAYGLSTNSIITPYGYIDSVQPWLDHPPLVGFLLMPVVIANTNPRVLPVFLDVGVACLLYLSLRSKDRLVASASAVSFVFYMASFPILSMLFLDSAVSFFLVLTVYLLARFSETRSLKWLYMSAVSAGLAFLSKVPGVAGMLFLSVFSANMVLTKKATSKHAILVILLAVGIASIWPIFGFLAEPQVFPQLLSTNISRTTLSANSLQETLVNLVSSASFTKQSYVQAVSPILVLSWVITVASILGKRYLWTSLALGSYLLVLLVLRYVPPQMTVPLFPYFAISVGVTAAYVARMISRHLRIRRPVE